MENNIENQQSPINYSTQNNVTQKKSRKGLIITLIILALIILSSLYYFNKNKYNSTDYADESSYDATSIVFTIPEYENIPLEYKQFVYYFMETNGYLDGTYFLTKIPDRAKHVFAFGDFTNDDNDYDDIAILLEKNDFKSSMLVLFNHNGEVLYVKHYEYDLPVINSFKVGSKIYQDDTKLTPSTSGGLIIKTDYNKEAIVYDKKGKKFNTYHQYSEEEIKAMEEAAKYYDQEEEYEDYDEAAGDEYEDIVVE